MALARQATRESDRSIKVSVGRGGPVRLVLQRRPDDPPLRAGMSVRVEIDTGHERTLPGFVDSALAWAKGQL